MKLSFVPAPKHRLGLLPRVGIAIVIIVSCILLARIIETYHGPGSACTFKAITSQPCPSCGLTRAAVAFSHGRFIDALLFNPLLTIAIGFCMLWLLVWWIVRIYITVDLSSKELWVGLALLVILIAANWAYVIHFVG